MNPLTASFALGQTASLKEPRILGGWLLWLEQRPFEGGRTTVLIRPWGRQDLTPQELTPQPNNLRTRMHGYGGAPLAAVVEGNQLLISWINDADSCLWFQCWEGIEIEKQKENPHLIANKPPICLSCHGEYLLADGLFDLSRNRWLGVMEKNGVDFLVTFDLITENQSPEIIYQATDFAGYLSLSPNNDQLAWVEWQQPFMPWDASQLCWSRFNISGDLIEKIVLAGSSSKDERKSSVFQPFWLEDGQLVVSEDSSGWSNLMVLGPNIQADSNKKWRSLWPMQSEAAMPQWVLGMSSNNASGKNIVSSICKDGIWELKKLNISGNVLGINQPFDNLSGLNLEGDKGVAIASNAFTESGLLEFDIKLGIWHHTPVRESTLSKDQISVPEPVWFNGFDGKLTHCWYYPPIGVLKKKPPLLVKIHSGPTAMSSNGLNFAIQFWTSRGWAVVDVNYGGSSGFGREYRERLKNSWGKVDVFDCTQAVKTLISAGKVDQNKIAIEGSSAGGFTTLACLCATDIFRVASCRYAVCDLSDMAKETHRFESGYLDYLLGSWTDQRNLYYEQSPLNNAQKISCPVIFFQGLKDVVVPPEQTHRMVEKLRNNNIDVELNLYQDEGHGFRNSLVRIEVLEKTELFYKKHLTV